MKTAATNADTPRASSLKRNLVLVFYCDPAKTPKEPTGTVMGKPPCVAIHLPDANCTVAVNFADAEQTADSPTGRITVGRRTVRIVR